MTTQHATIRVLATLLIAGLSTTAPALINPNFTPVHLVNQSTLVVELELAPVKDGRSIGTVKQILKGKLETKTLTFDLSATPLKEHAASLTLRIAANAGQSAIFFAGDLNPAQGGPDAAPGGGTDMEATTGGQKGFLHIQGDWASFNTGTNAVWQMAELSSAMGATWRGGTDMLILCVKYILTDPEAAVPAQEGVSWADAKPFGMIAGTVHAALPVDLNGNGKLALFIAADSGDRLFVYDTAARNMKDLTTTVTLTAKSRQAVWADFNGDGKLDLLSWDGETLTLHSQTTNGTFSPPEKLATREDLGGDCLGLAVVDIGVKGKPGVIASTPQMPLLLQPGDKGAPKPLPGPAPAASLKAAGACILADLDGDGLPDVLQLFANGSRFFRGKAPGQWNDPQPCAITLGGNPGNFFTGDFDADGLLDVVTCSPDAVCFWQNFGHGKFAEVRSQTGESSYNSDGATSGMTGDINNDGRQDFVLFFPKAPPRILFNRGFRSFGVANGMDISKTGMAPEAADGTQTGCWADLNGDGAQDMITIAANGQATLLLRGTEDTADRCVRGTLALGGPYAGPLLVTGWRHGRCLGAWNVIAGTAEAWVAFGEAGPVTLKWQFPGGKPQQKEVILENNPVRFVLTP